MKNISDEQLKAYFLGRLPETEAETFEIECASNPEIFARAQTIERELTDDYLRKNLPAAEIRLYETNYLVTEARHKKFQAAAHLWKVVKEPAPPLVNPVAIKSSPTSFWRTLFGKRHVFQFACGAFLLLAFGVVAFYLLTLDVNKTEVAEVQEPAPAAKRENPPTPNPDNQIVLNPDNQIVQKPAAENPNPEPAPTNKRVQNKEIEKDLNSPPKNQPATKTVPEPKTIQPNKPAILMTAKLLPGSLRGENEQALKIGPNVKTLHLLLSPAGEPNNYKTYRVVVRTPENNAIFTSPNLKSLSFKIPSARLENRTYIISLEGQNAKNEYESIADYTLRVRR